MKPSLLPLAFLLTLGTAALQAAPETKPAAPAAGVQRFEGILEAGIMAIGGETTGVILKTKDQGTYELDLAGETLRAAAEKLSGKAVVVEGEYKPRPGVEIKERRIIAVKSLKAA